MEILISLTWITCGVAAAWMDDARERRLRTSDRALTMLVKIVLGPLALLVVLTSPLPKGKT